VLVALVFFVYRLTSPVDLTWSNHGADGPELLTASLVGGVPHPPGYPIYTVLLGVWLNMCSWLTGQDNFPEYGVLFNNVLSSLAAGFTALAASSLLPKGSPSRIWPYFAALAWALTPVVWGQATIVEVYAMHSFAVSVLGWLALTRPKTIWLLVAVIGAGLAHHLTFAILLPSVFYYLWKSNGSSWSSTRHALLVIVSGLIVGLLFYSRTIIAASRDPVPPVNWGYADNLGGFCWLLSGSGYSVYLAPMGLPEWIGRLGFLVEIVSSQFTVAGLALALVGFAGWLKFRPGLSIFACLWCLPLLAFCVAYQTHDTEVYLSPLLWLAALSMTTGLCLVENWMPKSVLRIAVPAAVSVFICASSLYRWPPSPDPNSPRNFIQSAIQEVEPASIIVTVDAEKTFALWYAAWGEEILEKRVPGVVLINYPMFQNEWYQRLLNEIYPEVVGNSKTVEEVVVRNQPARAVYLTEKIPCWPAERMTKVGSLWKFLPPVRHP